MRFGVWQIIYSGVISRMFQEKKTTGFREKKMLLSANKNNASDSRSEMGPFLCISQSQSLFFVRCLWLCWEFYDVLFHLAGHISRPRGQGLARD